MGQCPGNLRWHMTGHLQSNKCRDAVHFFELAAEVGVVVEADAVADFRDAVAGFAEQGAGVAQAQVC